MEKNSDFQRHLREALTAKQMTQAELASKIGVSKAAVSQWISGRKAPESENIQKIAEILGVRAAWLTYGEGEGPSVDLTRERLKYQSETHWVFRPEPFDQGREYGNANVWSLPWDIETLVREACQNSMDAAIDSSAGIELEFGLIRLAGDDLSSFLTALQWEGTSTNLGLHEHIKQSITDAKEQKLGRILKYGLERFERNKEMLLLRIEDRKTSGLTGDEFGSGNFVALCRNNLDSCKASGSAGGAYGLGKAVFWRASQFATVLFCSNLNDPCMDDGQELAQCRLIGRTDLSWHNITKKGVFAGPGWFGKVQEFNQSRRAVSVWENEILASDLYLNLGQNTSTGTVILVVGFHDANSDETPVMSRFTSDIERAVAKNFWPALISGRLNVAIKACDGTNTRANFPVDVSSTQKAYVDMMRRFERGELSEKLKVAGDVVQKPVFLTVPRRKQPPAQTQLTHDAILLVRRDTDDENDDASNQVVFFRGREMIVKTIPLKQIVPGAVPFHAAVICGQAAEDDADALAAEIFLRTAEPPAHNDWTSTPEIKTQYMPGGKRNLDLFFQDVRDKIKDLVRPIYENLDDGPSVLKELLKIRDSEGPQSWGPRIIIDKEKSRVDEAERWVIEATVRVPDDSGWQVAPVLIFAAETGRGKQVDWRLEAIKGCRIEANSLMIPPGTKDAVFRGVSDPKSHPISAKDSAVIVSIKSATSIGE